MIYIFGTGHLGSSLAEYLSDAGHNLQVLGRNQWPAGFKQEDTIINCAGNYRPDAEVMDMVRDNVLLPVRLKTESNGANMIHISSWAEEVSPTTVYARTKGLASDYLSGCAHVCRVCAVWGGKYESPNKFMGSFLRAIASGTPYTILYPYLQRDYIHIDTFCEGIEQLIHHKDYKLRYFATGKMRSFWEIYCTAEDITGMRFPNVVFADDISTPTGFPWRVDNPVFQDTFRQDFRKEWEKING
jgi:nucleoside-diphosphate-sugar epimerase